MKTALPIPVTRVLRKLGNDVQTARRRRRISTATMAERVGISRTTLNKAEKGDPNVSLGIYAMILFVLGLYKQLEEVADAKHDSVGLILEEEQLPKRIRIKKIFDEDDRDG